MGLGKRRKVEGPGRRVRLSRIKGRQVIRVPLGFELAGHMAVVRRRGKCLVVEPVTRPDLLAVLATLRAPPDP